MKIDRPIINLAINHHRGTEVVPRHENENADRNSILLLIRWDGNEYVWIFENPEAKENFLQFVERNYGYCFFCFFFYNIFWDLLFSHPYEKFSTADNAESRTTTTTLDGSSQKYQSQKKA